MLLYRSFKFFLYFFPNLKILFFVFYCRMILKDKKDCFLHNQKISMSFFRMLCALFNLKYWFIKFYIQLIDSNFSFHSKLSFKNNEHCKKKNLAHFAHPPLLEFKKGQKKSYEKYGSKQGFCVKFFFKYRSYLPEYFTNSNLKKFLNLFRCRMVFFFFFILKNVKKYRIILNA